MMKAKRRICQHCAGSGFNDWIQTSYQTNGRLEKFIVDGKLVTEKRYDRAVKQNHEWNVKLKADLLALQGRQ